MADDGIMMVHETGKPTKHLIGVLVDDGATLKTLAGYIADYIQEEFSRGKTKADCDSEMIKNAIDAFEGGAR